MGEVELIDEALVGCYNLQNRIATLLAKLNDIKEDNSVGILRQDTPSIKAKSSRRRKNKGKNKSFSNAKPYDLITDANGRKNLSEISNAETETNLSNMFAKLSESFIEENSDAYSRSFNMDTENFFRNGNSINGVKYDSDTKILAKLNDIIVKVNAENSTNAKAKNDVSSTRGRKWKGNKRFNLTSFSKTQDNSPDSSNVSLLTDMQSLIDNSSDMELQQLNSYYSISDMDSNDSGFGSGLRSLQEINSAYAKIDKRFIEVKRSVESVAVGMRHVDEIINRQKGVFHLNFACAESETFICRH